MRGNLIALYSGVGIGLLIGVLMGLAVSPTVGIIIGALASSLAVMLGLNDKHFSDAKAIRIGSFGFACLLGAIFGIYMRSNSLLAPDVTAQFEKYREVGFTEQQALDFIAYERFGILNKDWKIYNSPIDSSGEVAVSDGSVPSGAELVHKAFFAGLYSAEVDESECVNLNDLVIADPLPFILQSFETSAGVFWKEVALAVEKEVNASHQKAALLAIRDGVCAQEGKFTDEDCQKFTTISQEASVSELHQQFIKIGGIWQSLALAVKSNVVESEQRKVMLILIRSACHENN